MRATIGDRSFPMRPSGRQINEMRKIEIETNVTMHAEGSCLIKCGIPMCFARPQLRIVRLRF